MTVQFAIVLVPVIFAFMGFAIDLGRLYLIRGELNQAASALALGAAAKLNSTTAAVDAVNTAVLLDTGNTYNFGANAVGKSEGLLNSIIYPPGLFSNLTEAVGAVGQSAVSGGDGTLAHYVTVNVTADAPLMFWSFFSSGPGHTTPIAASAVAGWSAPVCTACGIEPFAVPRQDAAADDPDNFGFVPGTLYTLGYQCTGAPTPGLLASTTARVPYLMIDRFDNTVATSEDQQLFQIGAQGLTPSPNPALACSRINGTENVWATATPRACNAAGANASVQDALCGLSTRLQSDTPAGCASNDAGYPADTDFSSITDYTSYAGNNRRLMTLPVVAALATDGTMTVVGFRQFLLEPNSGAASNTPSDADGRFVAMYVGTVAPVKQGRFDGNCGVTHGPGKVVLHQ